MTGICGVFNIAFRQENMPELDEMLHTFDPNNSDYISSWQGGAIAFGQATLHITPESYLEKLPLQQLYEGLNIVGDIRLDNREDLFLKFSIPKPQHAHIGDALLILMAYKHLGEDFINFLEGDFAFALWDDNRKCLYCAVDHIGLRSIFYHFDGKKFSFASTPNQLIALNYVQANLNFNKLSTLIFPESKHLFWEETWFDGIFPLSGATLLRIDKNGLHKKRYWTPEIQQTLSFKNDSDFAEAFQEVIFSAVENRLRSKTPVTALLSGGLDSSAVVSVAAKILEKQNKELQVFSAVLPEHTPTGLLDERYYIDQFKSFSNVKINYITAKNKGFLSNIEDLNKNIYGPNLISRHYLYTAFFKEAKTLGSRVLLDGGGGELGPSYHGDGYYAELFSNFSWIRLLNELQQAKKITGIPLRHNFLSKVLRPHLPSGLIDYIKKSPKLFDRTIPHCIKTDVVKLLHERLASKRNELHQLIEEKRLCNSVEKNQLLMWRQKQIKAQGTGDLGEIEVRFPLMDKRLLAFCLAIPTHFKVRNGYSRYSVRTGLDQILPKEIQWRTSKGPFSPDYNVRYNQQLEQAKNYVNAIANNDPIHQVVNIEQLKRWLTLPLSSAEYNTFAEKAARDYVPQGIYLIQFLRRFKNFSN